MTTDVINVSRSLLADLLSNDREKRVPAERHLYAILANTTAQPAADWERDLLAKAAAEIRDFEKSGWHGGGGYHAGLLKAAQITEALAAQPQQAVAAECERLRGEVSDLHTTMMAAAVEIQGHWAAHCDEEGYGPANLMHRLEHGIASQYGYNAETVVRMEAQRDAALAELATVKKVAYGNLELLDETELLKAELAALKGGQEAVAMIRYARGVPGFENEMPHVVSCNDLPDGLYPVYLAPPAQASAWVPEATEAMVLAARGVCVGFSGHYGEHNDYLDDCTARQIIEAALSVHKTGEEE